MDYRTLVANLAGDADGIVFDVHSLYAHFLRLRDRRQRQGLRYPLALILVAATLAKLCGADTPRAIADWVRARQALLLEAFQVPYPRMPSHNTYRRVLGWAVALTDLEAQVSAFWQHWPDVSRAVRVTLDGKTLRGTIAVGQTRGLHLLAAFLPEAGVVLLQVEVEPGTNEIPVAGQVLKVLDLRGKIVTGDALLTQREVAEVIVAGGGEYVLTVKENQPRLYQDIAQLFAPEVYVPGFSPAPPDFRTATTVNKGHGRLETRRLTSSSLLNETCDWPGLGQVFRLERETRLMTTGEVRQQVAYGVTSLTAAEAGPLDLLAWVRGHWAIENSLHYRRDVSFQEDAGRTHHWNLAHALAVLNNLALALLLHAGQGSLPRARRFFGAHPDEALRLLLCRPA